MVDVVESNTTMLDWTVVGLKTAILDWRDESELVWGVEEWLTEFFTCFFTSSNDLIRRVGFFFFDRRMIRVRMRLMRMRRTTRETRMIMRVDTLLTTKKSWVWIDPTWFEAWIVTSMKSDGVEGIPDIFPVVSSNTNPSGRVPEVTLKWRRSPDMIGAVEK